MKTEIASGHDWDLRLQRHGLFALRWDKRQRIEDDGGTSWTSREATGQTPAAVFAGLWSVDDPERVATFHAALREACHYQGQADALRKAYLAKLRAAMAAAKAQRAGADVMAQLADLRALTEGAA